MIEAPSDRWVIDLRSNSPANWAHFLNNHLPALFAVADAADLDPARVLALLPARIPDYILEAARLFDIEVLCTNATVHGEGVTFEFNPWGALRSGRCDWVKLPWARKALQRISDSATEQELPKKVFLTRSATRKVSNLDLIEPILSSRGFQTILPETLTPADQFRLFFEAEEMVAIHGAGLAPLLYCDADNGPNRLIEILPCGHMTNVYRAIANEVGCQWMGLRGRIKPEYVRHVYDTDKPAYTRHSLDDFEVDPVSLDRAFELSGA